MDNGRDTNAARRSAKKVRLRTLDDLDNRYASARHARALVDRLMDDLGGRETLSAARQELITRAALTGALCEDIETRWISGEPVVVADYALLANAQRRLLVTVGLERIARDVSPTSADRYRRFVEAYEAAP
jgi:hypothetical protein